VILSVKRFRLRPGADEADFLALDALLQEEFTRS
jgi:hypothetical protein